jgi:Xaa-Pro aminopeptidase
LCEMKQGKFPARLARLQEAAGRNGWNGVVIVPGPNMTYLTGVHSFMLERPFMLLVPTQGTPQLLAPALEAGPYAECGLGIDIHKWTDSQGPGRATKAAVGKVRMSGKWGVEARAPFGYLNSVMAYASPSAADAEPTLQGLREVKDESEVRSLRRAANLLSRVFEGLPGLIRVGMTEAELARKTADRIAEVGADGSGDLLVQSGAHSADPHSTPTRKKIRKGESVVIDLSCSFDGYYADVTRTFCLGKSEEVERVYARVLEAQEAAIRRSAVGVEVGAVDLAARGTLRKAGLGEKFIHRTGHGLGLEIHESPYIVEGGKERLRDGMCFTVEPGAYLRGKFGVRIEDDVLVKGGRGVTTTNPPKEYRWWT